MEDVKYAYDLSLYWLKKIGMTENGLDANQALTGVLESDTQVMKAILELMKERKEMTRVDLINTINNRCKNLMTIEDMLEKLYRRGDLMYPRGGIVKAL
jgi:DNA replicative helicase MCM subunit Mcm2 (Cdc46/Mcm family)